MKIGPNARMSGIIEDKREFTAPGQANLGARLDKKYRATGPAVPTAARAAGDLAHQRKIPSRGVSQEVIDIRDGTAFDDYFGGSK